MEKSTKYAYAVAFAVANDVLDMIRPYCLRAEIAGSLRRKKAEVGDIEIVAIPRPADLEKLASVVNQWTKVKGELPCKYTQRILPSGIKLDLFFAEKSNWGLIFAVRTGSADYSHMVLARGWVRQGYKSKDGHLYRGDREIDVYEEKELFKLIDRPYLEPEGRSI
jgi:DNA polymerase/3'-5' exonuclease PolX